MRLSAVPARWAFWDALLGLSAEVKINTSNACAKRPPPGALLTHTSLKPGRRDRQAEVYDDHPIRHDENQAR
jgi:hypothetical protein